MIKKTLLALLGLYLILLVGFYFLQENILFQAKKLSQDFNFSFAGNYKELSLKAQDGALISAVHFKVKDPKGVLLFFHGNRGNLERWGNLVLPYTEYQYDVFVIDYRSYGKTHAKPDEALMYLDGQLAYDHLKQQFNEDKIVIYGRSLGCTFATYVASKNQPKALVLEAPFYNLTDVLKSKFNFLPYNYILKYKFSTDQMIGAVRSPTYIFHGTDDKLISIKSSKKLYERSNKKHTQFISLKGGTHHNLATFNSYQTTLESILN